MDSAAMNESEIIIELRAEGGCVVIYGFRTEQGWSFIREVTDWTSELIDEDRIHNKSAVVDSWEAALELLDQYPWPKLFPVSIHPDFRERIWIAVQKRLDSTIESSKLEQWRELCHVG
jgi:hypothetical protein